MVEFVCGCWSQVYCGNGVHYVQEHILSRFAYTCMGFLIAGAGSYGGYTTADTPYVAFHSYLCVAS